MFNKYIKVNEKKIIVGQTSSGVWYCKEAVVETTQELKVLIGDINVILNECNIKPKDAEEKQPNTKKK